MVKSLSRLSGQLHNRLITIVRHNLFLLIVPIPSLNLCGIPMIIVVF